MNQSRFYVAAISLFPKDAGLFKESIRPLTLREVLFPLVEAPTTADVLIMDNKKTLSDFFIARLGKKAVRDYPVHDERDGFKKVKAVQFPFLNIVVDVSTQLAFIEYVYALNYDITRFLEQFDSFINRLIAQTDHEIRTSVKTDKAALETTLAYLVQIRRAHYQLLPPNRISRKELKDLLYAARAAGANQRVDLDLAAGGGKASIDRDAPLIRALDAQVAEGGGSATYTGCDAEGHTSKVRTRDMPRKKSIVLPKKLEEMSDVELDTFLREELIHGEA